MYIKVRKQIKDIQIGTEEVKLPLFTENMIIYIEKSVESTKKLVEIIASLARLQETRSTYKKNPPQNPVFPYTKAITFKL